MGLTEWKRGGHVGEMKEPMPRDKKQMLIKLAVLGVIIGVIGVMVLRGMDGRALITQGLDMLREAGPWTFFIMMVLLPAIGVPMSVFTLTAAPAFADNLGLLTVVLLGVSAIVANLALTYWLSAKALRPLFVWLLQRLGFRMPTAASRDTTDLIILARVTPGLPFFAQSYLLGLAGVPFGKYMIVSCLISVPMNIAFIIFGDALLQGKGKMVLLIFSGIVALTALTHLIRRHYGKKQVKS